ncbi:MAG: M24 family metallopeptidase [Brevinema sp.]
MRKTLKNPIFEKRVVQLQSTLNVKEAFLTVGAADIYYLTGCSGSNNHVLIFHDDVYLFTDGRYLTQIDEQTQISSLHIEEIGPKRSFGEALHQILLKHDVMLLKFATDTLSYNLGKEMIDALPPQAQMVKDMSLFELRSIKDEVEIETIRENLYITKAAFLYIIGILKPGMTEIEVAAELEYFCRKQGADKMAFDSIIASGVRGALPHGIASHKIIQDNEFVQFDFGFYRNKYCSDFSRVVALGNIDPQLHEIRQIVEDSVKKVIEDARCGMTGQEIDAIARNYITEKGYGAYFVHGLGHALGLDVHENPRLNTVWNKPIRENMVLTVEPGIYLPNIGGIRLEDVVVMRSDKFELITDCGYEF